MSAFFDTLQTASDHISVGAVGAAVTSAVGTAIVTTQPILVPDGTPWWVAASLTALGPVLTLVAHRLLAARAARLRRRAERKEQKAAEKLSDSDPTNDHEAASLLDDAAEDRADADALEALKPRG